ncbi:hypothetical protein HK405_000349, partial [Cladochytrium tenue]
DNESSSPELLTLREPPSFAPAASAAAATRAGLGLRLGGAPELVAGGSGAKARRLSSGTGDSPAEEPNAKAPSAETRAKSVRHRLQGAILQYFGPDDGNDGSPSPVADASSQETTLGAVPATATAPLPRAFASSRTRVSLPPPRPLPAGVGLGGGGGGAALAAAPSSLLPVLQTFLAESRRATANALEGIASARRVDEVEARLAGRIDTLRREVCEAGLGADAQARADSILHQVMKKIEISARSSLQ